MTDLSDLYTEVGGHIPLLFPSHRPVQATTRPKKRSLSMTTDAKPTHTRVQYTKSKRAKQNRKWSLEWQVVWCSFQWFQRFLTSIPKLNSVTSEASYGYWQLLLSEARHYNFQNLGYGLCTNKVFWIKYQSIFLWAKRAISVIC